MDVELCLVAFSSKACLDFLDEHPYSQPGQVLKGLRQRAYEALKSHNRYQLYLVLRLFFVICVFEYCQ